MTLTSTSKFAFTFALLVGGLILAAASWALLAEPVGFLVRREQFELAVVQVLVPVFSSTVITVAAFQMAQSLLAVRRAE